MAARRINPFLKLALDFGPLVIFFVAITRYGILVATAVIMAAVTVSLVVGYAIERKVSLLPLMTAGMVLVFGGLSLWFNDATFIKMKPTILYTLFAALLLGGLFVKRLFIKVLLEHSVHLPDYAWRALTWRWSFFFLVMAVANEFVWRNYTDQTWATFKIGMAVAAVGFAAAQTPYLMRHQIEDEPQAAEQ